MFLFGIGSLEKIFIRFFFGIDRIIFNFIPVLYDLLISIARTSILSQADILDMAERIYKLLAIFMVFKVTFSLIMYTVNPDDFSDKSKGIGKLGLNSVIALLLLILTPYIFNYAYRLQTIILEDNSLATLVFGNNDNGVSNNAFSTAGEKIAYVTMQPFFSPNVSITELSSCVQLLEKDGEKVKFSKACSDALTDVSKSSPSTFSEQTKENYIAGVELGSLGLMFRRDAAVATDSKGESIIEYRYIICTAIGVVVALLLLSFSLDVAVRGVKLAFLQLIAPIPIMSYVDPKSGKDGMFKKWYEMCFKTFISLFVRLLALYFAVYIISRVNNMVDIIDGSYVSNMYIKIFVIIGALMFAKQFPKILEGLGIKLDGDGKFNLNPLRKIENEALGGQILKKPNDMLAKMGKGILKSPISGLSLLGKKTIGGIDAARHGKGFKQGWDRTHGNLTNKFYKKLDEWAPDSAEARKNERLGREEFRQMHTKWSKGEAIAKRFKDNHYEDFSALNGLDTPESEMAYDLAGFTGEFRKSKKKLDKSSETLKLLSKLNSAASMNPEGLAGAIRKLSEDEREAYAAYGIELEGLTETVLSKKLDDEQKKNSGLEKVHETMRKQYQDQADIEDQIKFVKYNSEDPTSDRVSVLPVSKEKSSSESSSGESPADEGDGGTSEGEIELAELLAKARVLRTDVFNIQILSTDAAVSNQAKSIIGKLDSAVASKSLNSLRNATDEAQSFIDNHKS